ncbi:MAG: SiaC family regulatory phosphoprotein, partial [Bacteroidales bacterium]|nr:SiaC family regulatory phosphoprotein [Bacteroidales bacterium]
MKNILIPSGENTPEISENAQSASFIVSGASAPDNPVAFFSQVNETMEAFVARTTGPKIIRFD